MINSAYERNNKLSLSYYPFFKEKNSECKNQWTTPTLGKKKKGKEKEKILKILLADEQFLTKTIYTHFAFKVLVFVLQSNL